MNVFLRFNSGVMRMSAPARVWLLLLVTANMVIRSPPLAVSCLYRCSVERCLRQ